MKGGTVKKHITRHGLWNAFLNIIETMLKILTMEAFGGVAMSIVLLGDHSFDVVSKSQWIYFLFGALLYDLILTSIWHLENSLLDLIFTRKMSS
jgi:hypothetical protein